MLRRVATILITLIVIALMTRFGLLMAERGREGVPGRPFDAAGQAAVQIGLYLTDHPRTYLWHRTDVPAFELVLTLLGRSAALLIVSLIVAMIVGTPLGVAMALGRGRRRSTAMLLVSVLGISIPSFLLAMLLWIVNIRLSNLVGVKPLPPTGFGLDAHILMPALVLAARPLAQVAQVTYISMSEVLSQEYIRAASGKGLTRRQVILQHALPNIRVPVLTTLGASLRFSLASLVVVEYFFYWPGVGTALLEAIALGISPLVVDLMVALGLLFLLLNWLLDAIAPLLDPRLRGAERMDHVRERDAPALPEWVAEIPQMFKQGWRALQAGHLRLHRKVDGLPPLPARAEASNKSAEVCPSGARGAGRVIRHALTNPILLVGAALMFVFLFLAAFGYKLTDSSPYQIHGIMTVDGKIAGPPFRPSTPFPWGTDHIGRDVQALVLNGARQTLILAFFGTLARILLGTILGLFAGWWAGGRFDQLVTGAIGVWAAFPITLFGVILIQGLGIQQGMWVFIVALCVVGWGEVAQVIRRQVMSLKTQPYMEAAWSVGARANRLLGKHALPHLVPLLLVLAALEMGGILMLLAELGFLNTFLGGGFRVEIGEAGRMQPVIAYFSDVPEWGALLANIRDWWRSYPWMAWYPGVAFFLAILTFNLLGEGLRRFLDESRINVGRLLNRYTAIAVGATVLGLVLLLRSATPIGVYRSVARQFDPERALADIRALSAPEFEGRETGTVGAKRAAEYVAQRMEEIGLFPAGDLTPTKGSNSFIQSLPIARPHLTAIPRLEILGQDQQVIEALVYRKDFVENAVNLPQHATTGPVVGLATGADPGSPGRDPYLLGKKNLRDAVMIVVDPGEKRINYTSAAGTLIVSDDPGTLQRKQLFAEKETSQREGPVMYITPALADRLLKTAGSSLAELKSMEQGLKPGEAAVTGTGATVNLAVPLITGFDQSPDEGYHNVIGFIPGTGAQMGSGGGRGLDSQVIMVAAYLDGLGVGPDGTLYPSANDNASGVAAMLEMARLLKESPYQPKKTIVFVAWSGGERQEGLSVTNVMNAKIGFPSLSVESVIEVSGLGAGDGKEVALGEGSSYRLTQLFQKAAGRLGVATTTRGRGPHSGAEVATAFGGRDALSLYISWNGSDRQAHTPADTWEAMDLEKLRKAGESTLLTLSVLSREVKY